MWLRETPGNSPNAPYWVPDIPMVPPPFPPPLHLTKEQSNADFTKAEIRSSLPPCSAACAYLVSARCCAKGTQQFRMKILNSNEHDTYVMIIMAIITIITSYSWLHNYIMFVIWLSMAIIF